MRCEINGTRVQRDSRGVNEELTRLTGLFHTNMHVTSSPEFMLESAGEPMYLRASVPPVNLNLRNSIRATTGLITSDGDHEPINGEYESEHFNQKIVKCAG